MLSPDKQVTKSKSAAVKLPARVRVPEYVLGVDGGGTKTHAVIADEHGRVLGEGFAGPSNPLRVGVNNAAAAVREAADQACDAAGVRRTDIVAAEVGLAGVRRADLRERVRESLLGLGINSAHFSSQAYRAFAPGGIAYLCVY